MTFVRVPTREVVNDPQPLLRHQLGDHLESSSLELDEQGEIISYEEYYPYGSTSYQAVDSQTEVSGKRYRFTGKERDEESGLYYHGARYYAPWLARWTAADPAGMVDGPNLFAYVRGNPVRLVDPDGRAAVAAIPPIIVGGAIKKAGGGALVKWGAGVAVGLYASTTTGAPDATTVADTGTSVIDKILEDAAAEANLPAVQQTQESSGQQQTSGQQPSGPQPSGPQPSGGDVVKAAASKWRFKEAQDAFLSHFTSSETGADFETAMEAMYGFETTTNLYSHLDPEFKANIFYGNLFNTILALQFAGMNPETEKYFMTDDGARRVDIFLPEHYTAIEAKVGSVNFSARIMRQIDKDIWLRENNDKIDSLQWHFAVSPKTGEVGPDAQVRQYLEDHDVEIVIYDETGAQR